jgi:N-acetylmuramoyl-L-alanine amidase
LLLLILIVSDAVAEALPVRVLNAEGEKIASLEALESGEARYISLGEVSRLFRGTSRYEPLIGRVTVTMMNKRIVLTLGQHQLKIDDEDYFLSNPPVSISGKVAVPVEFLTEVLPDIIGKRVILDQEDWILQISGEPFVKRDNSEVDSQVLPELTSTGFRVVIDPGHGGYDIGARSKDGLLLEKDLTLRIAQQTKELLAAEEGVDVYLTRSEDNYMTTAERVNFANKLHGHLYLSIHFNSSPSQRSRGFRVYINSSRMRLGTGSGLEADMFSRTKPAADELSSGNRFLLQSKRLAREITDRLKIMKLKGEQDKEAFLAVMDNLSMPGVLLEVLYLSNPQDLVIISRPDFIGSVSQALRDSILAFRSALEDKGDLGAMR